MFARSRASTSTSNRGELLTIVGPSGSGKTTLLQIMGTLDRATAGEVWIDGFDAAAASDDELSALRARRIGFVFQQFYLLDGLSAVDNVAGGLLYSGLPSAAAPRAGARGARARRPRTSPRRTTRTSSRAARSSARRSPARSSAGRRSSSPTSPRARWTRRTGESIVELLRELNAAGTTIVVITHDTELAASFPRQVAVRDGRDRPRRNAGRGMSAAAAPPAPSRLLSRDVLAVGLDRPAHAQAAGRAVGDRRRDRHRLDGRRARASARRARPRCSTRSTRSGRTC